MGWWCAEVVCSVYLKIMAIVNQKISILKKHSFHCILVPKFGPCCWYPAVLEKITKLQHHLFSKTVIFWYFSTKNDRKLIIVGKMMKDVQKTILLPEEGHFLNKMCILRSVLAIFALVSALFPPSRPLLGLMMNVNRLLKFKKRLMCSIFLPF